MAHQKTEGNMDDVHRVIANLKDGMPWHLAIRKDEFMPTEDAWYEKNRALLLKWTETGIPQPAGLTSTATVRQPIQTAVTADGKVWALYRDGTGNLYREEVKQQNELPPPPELAPEAPARIMSPEPDVAEKPNKKKW